MAISALHNPDLFRHEGFVGGVWKPSVSGRVFPVVDPADQSVLVEVADMGGQDALDAITAAHNAQEAWKQRPAAERADVLRAWFELITCARDDLALLMTAEQGKPLAEARGEVTYAASFVQWFAEEARRAYGDVIPSPLRDRRLLVLKEPVGVVAAITPWNFPAAMITRKCAPALAAGCSVVIKPAGETPLSALALAVLAEQAGFPPGVLNVLPSSRSAEIGAVLTRDPRVRKLSFTGSTRVGKILMQQCAETVKKVSLELGGNAPFIVFDDADLDAAMAGALASKYRNTGQTCVCANRFLVQEGIYPAFADCFAKAVAGLRVGPGAAEGVSQGPLITMEALQKVEGLVNEAKAQGARVLVGGARHALGGTFFEPTVLGDVQPSMRAVSEEIFGPVAPLIRFRDEVEAIRMANDTPFGLAAYFYTRDIGRIWRVSEALEYGIIGINEGIVSTEVAPFGGMKESGIGREGSRYGLDEFMEVKYLCLGGLQGQGDLP
ncbi:NAD-dependent succinate-semialdehyde dehydrogenase [Haematospirillum sp. 15-248]|uniref:NAD-dependent succinate-semialdehyde dehydrogenase n=1 Tax=Haematospirillum sp. 15-248 TaxID=2723107 RepID=UPI001439CA16|nr:NAD-dependent succinate-semialdehyde dehydrogenase [Haematospirillum sp. 15-248]NKD88595.1 NAD-dependent succinate-semialdehyde dehydrogenase [Haematospirillum sp. 15-248]